MSRAKPPAKPADPADPADLVANLAAECTQRASDAYAVGERPRHDAEAVVGSVRNIVFARTAGAEELAALSAADRADTERLRADFDAAAIDETCVGAGAALLDAYLELTGGTPSDRRKILIYSATERQDAEKAARPLGRACDAIARKARARFRLADAADFGRGKGFRLDSPPDVHGALETFLAGAKKHPDLVAAIKMKPEQLDAFAKAHDAIGRVVQRKPMRTAGKVASTDEIARAQLAVESWLEDLGGDATWGLEDDMARTRVLGVLPRMPDRRKRAVDNPPAKDEPKKGEAPATEAEKSDAAPAETPKK